MISIHCMDCGVTVRDIATTEEAEALADEHRCAGDPGATVIFRDADVTHRP